MKHDPDKHHRHSIRWRGYDYSQSGVYFVTICTQNKECLFGAIEDNVMRLNDAGKMVCRWYGELENKFPDIECDAFVCMPNHTHFVVVNVGADLRVCPNRVGQTHVSGRTQQGQTHRSAPTVTVATMTGEHIGSPLPRVVQWFKTMTTNEYIRGVKQNGWAPFPGKLWQRNYYEHVVRDDDDLNRIRQYIIDNPAQWATDMENPIVLHHSPPQNRP